MSTAVAIFTRHSRTLQQQKPLYKVDPIIGPFHCAMIEQQSTRHDIPRPRSSMRCHGRAAPSISDSVPRGRIGAVPDCGRISCVFISQFPRKRLLRIELTFCLTVKLSFSANKRTSAIFCVQYTVNDMHPVYLYVFSILPLTSAIRSVRISLATFGWLNVGDAATRINKIAWQKRSRQQSHH